MPMSKSWASELNEMKTAATKSAPYVEDLRCKLQGTANLLIELRVCNKAQSSRPSTNALLLVWYRHRAQRDRFNLS